MATVVVLNGTSSSGKTTIARAFQDIAPRVFLNFSIDSILYALPPQALERMKRGDLTGLDTPKLVRAYYACVRQLLDLGHDLVIDNAITTRHQAELLLEAIASHDVVMVGLDCPPDALEKRERDRADRRPGMAVAQREHIHKWLFYDLMVNTTAASAHEIAQRILERIDGGGSVTGDIQADIPALMGEISRAFIERDIDTLNAVLDDNFTITEPSGRVVSKHDWLEDVRSGELKIDSVTSQSFEMKPIPGGASVRGRLTLEATYSKSNYNGTFDYLGVYTKKPDGWKLLLSSARRVT